jgi:hypothetical protein
MKLLVPVIITLDCFSLRNIYTTKRLQLLVDKQTSHTHTSTNAHTGEQDLLLLPPALAQTCDNLAGTCATQRVAERDSAAPDVELVVVDLEGLEAVDRHGGESLVELDEVNVVEGKLELVEELGDGDRGTDTHDPRGQTGDSGADVLGEDGLAEGLGLGALHQQDGGGAVSQLRGVAGVRPVTVGQESGLDLLQRLECGTSADALVLCENDLLLLAGLGVLDGGLDGSDLVVEPTSLLRDLGTAVGLSGVPVLALTRDVEVLANVLGCLAHGLHAVPGLRVLEDLVDEGALEPVAASGHALGTHGNTALDGANGDLVGNVLDSLETRRAEAVKRGARCGVGEAGGEHGGAHIVGSLCV